MEKKAGRIGMVCLAVSLLTGCGGSKTAQSASLGASTSSASDEVRKIYVAHTQAYRPFDYVNEEGQSDGYEVQVLKAVDQLLDDYEFEFVPTTDDDLLIGVESGKYQIGVKGAWYTEERAKKFIYPKHAIGASSIGIVYRTENADVIHDMESFAAYSGKLVPIAPQNAQYNIVEEYNAQHTNQPIKLVASDAFDIADAYQWVLEGRYDAYFNIKSSFENNVLVEDGPYHQYADKLTYSVYEAIPTYSLINIKETELADEFDTAFQKLWDDGTIEELEQQYFGEDVFQYVNQK